MFSLKNPQVVVGDGLDKVRCKSSETITLAQRRIGNDPGVWQWVADGQKKEMFWSTGKMS